MERLLLKGFLEEKEPDLSREIEEVARLNSNEMNLNQLKITEDLLQSLKKFERVVNAKIILKTMIQTKKKNSKKKIAEIVQVFEGIQKLMLKTIRIFQFR